MNEHAVTSPSTLVGSQIQSGPRVRPWCRYHLTIEKFFVILTWIFKQITSCYQVLSISGYRYELVERKADFEDINGLPSRREMSLLTGV